MFLKSSLRYKQEIVLLNLRSSAKICGEFSSKSAEICEDLRVNPLSSPSNSRQP